MLADRIAQQPIQFFFGILESSMASFSGRLPVGVRSGLSVGPFHNVAGRKLLNAANHGVRRRDVVQTHKAIQTIQVDLPLDDRILEDGFDFGPKKEIAAGAAEVERFDTDAISHQDQTFLRPDPNRKCKHPTQSFKTFDAPFTKSM
ncbi:MAG: hypothetical protein AUG74_19785 [Bacteroidetes bacterium 13_1_20CM_4_60_6]|nr:MAG: hypothetical protein AUG74_19785 [Bacteroidetes bacterium 13_1_20CM_4_60_6]